MGYKPLSENEEEIGKTIVNAAFLVHKQLGPGLLENIYETCCHELRKTGLIAAQQVSVPVFYDSMKLDAAFRLDVLVSDLVICELKAVDAMNPIYEAQLLSYLKLTGKRLGYLINFNVPIIKHGIKRIIL